MMNILTKQNMFYDGSKNSAAFCAIQRMFSFYATLKSTFFLKFKDFNHDKG